MLNEKLSELTIVHKFFILIIIILVMIFIVFLFMPVEDVKSVERDQLIIPKIDCEIVKEAGIFKFAIENNSLEACNCIEEIDRKNICKTSIKDSINSRRAIENLDLKLCETLSTQRAIDSCKLIVSSGEKYISTKDPRFIGDLAISKGDYNKSIILIEEALSQNGDDVASLISLSIAYANQALFEHREDELIPKALDLVNKAIELAPEYPGAHSAKGFIYEVQPNLFLAIESYTKAIEIDPNYIYAYLGRGHAFNKLGDITQAQRDFEKAKELDVNGDYIDIDGQLCRLYLYNPETFEKSIEHCNLLIASPKADYDQIVGAYITLAEIDLYSGDFDKAIEKLNLGLEYVPDHADAHVFIAKLRNRKEEYLLAEEHARIAIKKDPFKSSAFAALSYSLFQQSKFEEAIQNALLGLEYVDGDASLLVPSKNLVRKDLYYTLANIYSHMGNKTEELKYKELGDSI